MSSSPAQGRSLSLHLLLRSAPDSLLSTVILALFVSTFLAPHTVHHFHPFNPFSINGLNNYIFGVGFWHKCTLLESCFCLPPTPRPDSRQQLHNKTVCKIVRGQRAACSSITRHTGTATKVSSANNFISYKYPPMLKEYFVVKNSHDIPKRIIEIISLRLHKDLNYDPKIF